VGKILQRRVLAFDDRERPVGMFALTLLCNGTSRLGVYRRDPLSGDTSHHRKIRYSDRGKSLQQTRLRVGKISQQMVSAPVG